MNEKQLDKVFDLRDDIDKFKSFIGKKFRQKLVLEREIKILETNVRVATHEKDKLLGHDMTIKTKEQIRAAFDK